MDYERGMGMDDLADRLGRLEDERAILATLYRYGASLDHDNREEFLDCFTVDADYLVSMRVDPSKEFGFHGHEELGVYFDGHTHAPRLSTSTSPRIHSWQWTVTWLTSRVISCASTRLNPGQRLCSPPVATLTSSNEATTDTGVSERVAVRWRTCDRIC